MIVYWNRKNDELARRAVIDTGVKDFDIIVEHGTEALLFQDGVFVEILKAGRHQLSKRRMFRRDHALTRLVWVFVLNFEQNFLFEKIRSCDNIPFQVSLSLALSIENSSLFYQGLIKNRDSYRQNRLKNYLSQELLNSMEEFIATRPASRLASCRIFKDQLEMDLHEHARLTLQSNGLNCRVQSLTLFNPQLESVNDSDATWQLTKRKGNIDRQMEEWNAHNLLENRQRNANLREQQITQEFQEKRKYMKNRQEIEKAECEHQLQIRRMRLEDQCNRQMLETQYHNALEQEKLTGDLQKRLLKQKSDEDLRQMQLTAAINRKKLQVEQEAQIAEVIIETQSKRAQAAIHIREKLAQSNYKTAHYRLNSESGDRAKTGGKSWQKRF